MAMQAIRDDDAGNLHGVIERLVASGIVPAWTLRLSPVISERGVTILTSNSIVRDLAVASPGAIKAVSVALAEATGLTASMAVEFVPPAEEPEALNPVAQDEPEAEGEPAAEAGVNGPEGRPPQPLDELVVGDFNVAAHWAISRIAAGAPPGVPVVIYGGHGLGKTRLLREAAARIGHMVEHITAEDFANQFVAATASRNYASFRARFREAKALIVDDVHFLADKPRMQDELVRAIESVALRGGSVILSSLTLPSPSCGMSERLVSWIRGGFPAALGRPGPATMAQIVSVKASARGIELPRDVVAMVANGFRRSVREAEGAVNRLVAAASMTGGTLDAAGAATALADMLNLSKRILVPIEEIAEAVSSRTGVPVAGIQGPSRKKREATARQTFIWLASRLTGQSLSSIGQWCGGRDHSTVIYSVRRIDDDADAKAEAEALEEMLRSAPERPTVKTGRAQVVYRA